ncbi:MAG: methionine gamma-lyase family protein, partial [Clostridia bacterium]
IDSNICIMVDNCYGEFMDTIEPTSVGVDVMAGSLNKNPGGGIVPTGGYVCGKAEYVDKVAGRLTAPSVGCEIGSNVFGYQYYYQGLFQAPHVTLQATKGSILFAYALDELGYDVLPKKDAPCNDIIRSVKLNTKEELVAFIQAIQTASPVDSYLTLEAWDMPGYVDQVIMAAGCFVEGASIELSADAPIKEPYIAYLQGGLTYEHCKCALEICLNAILK